MRRRLKKILILVLIFGVIIAGVAAFFILNSSADKLTDAEKEQAVAEILGRKPNLNPDVKTGNVEFNGKKLTFSYPAKAEVYEGQANAKKESTLDSFSFDIENPRLILNYTAVNKPDLNSLDDEPAVKLRQDSTRGYESGKVEIDGVNGLGFAKKEGGGNRAEHTGFILNNGVLYTISVSGASLEDVDELFEQIVSSATFK